MNWQDYLGQVAVVLVALVVYFLVVDKFIMGATNEAM